MEKYHIKLTESEAATLAKIDLKESHRNHDEGHAAYKANAQPILALLQSLGDRSAVPQERLNYWNELVPKWPVLQQRHFTKGCWWLAYLEERPVAFAGLPFELFE